MREADRHHDETDAQSSAAAGLARRRESVRLTAFGVLLSLAVLPPALSATLDQSNAGRWTVSASSDDARGTFTRCEAASDAQDGVALLLSIDPSLKWTMAFSGKLGVQTGETHPVQYRVDRGPVFIGNATAVSETLLQVPLTDPAALVRELRRGRKLTADAGSDRLTFALRDVSLGLERLRDCVQRWAKATAVTATTQPRQQDQAQVAAAPTRIERRLEATTVAVNILSRAQVIGFELQPKDVPARFTGHDVTWRAQNLAGSLRIVGLEGGGSAQKISADLISADIVACADRFTAEANGGSDGKGLSLFTRCEGEAGWSVSYLILPRATSGAYVLSILGGSDKADDLRTALDTLRNAALQVVRTAP